MATLVDFSKTLAAASREAKALKGATVVIGWKDPDIANYMAINEYGAPNIPARPLLRLAAQRFTTAGRTKILGRTSAKEFLKNVGERGKEALQSAFDSNSFTSNKPSTIRKKGSNKPLIDTGAAREEITYEVRNG